MSDSKLEVFVREVLPAVRKAELLRSLPSHIDPDTFMRNLYNALMASPDLMRCPAPYIYREVSKAAGLGLLLDPLLGEAYMVVAYNPNTRQKEPQLRVGYRGMMKLARMAYGGAMIYAHEVRENDFIDCDQGVERKLVHRPELFRQRGEIVGYYAVIKFKDGAWDFEPMSVDEVHAIRERSDGWKAFKDGRIKSTPWATDEIEMAKKTVIRRLMKRQPQTREMAQAIEIEDRAEFAQFDKRIGRPPKPYEADVEWPESPASPQGKRPFRVAPSSEEFSDRTRAMLEDSVKKIDAPLNSEDQYPDPDPPPPADGLEQGEGGDDIPDVEDEK
jgi:recombination protein RecT